MTNKQPFNRVGVIGGGAWGTALASLCATTTSTLLWARNTQVVAAINDTHENSLYLPGIPLPKSLNATSDLASMAECDALLFVAPSQSARALLGQVREVFKRRAVPVALCSKGIERGTLLPMNDVLAASWPEAIPAILSGPSFASDVARGLPTAVTLACKDETMTAKWLATLQTASFRPYASTDIVGAELGGAVKNVLAIACGIVVGKGLGESAKAALMARGFVEFQRFGAAMGAKPQTMAGLSGLGDLILTCSSPQSRNMSLGLELGRGKTLAQILAERRSVSEGAASALAVVQLAARHRVEMPICEAVADIIENGADVDQTIIKLMSRPLRAE